MRIVWRNVRVLDMVKILLARILHRLCGTWYGITEVSDCGAFENVVDREGVLHYCRRNSLVNGGVRIDECE